MAMPTLTVEFRAPGGTWRTITSYVQTVNIDRGGDRDISEVSAGSCNVVLFNRDRRFDPKYSSSPYFGEIVPVGEVRIASQGAYRFYGYITAWNFTYDLEGNSYAIISATDGLSEIAKKNLIEYTPPAQLSGIRIDNVLSRAEVNWPSSLRNLEAGSTLYNYVVTGGTNALTYIQQCAGSEGGLFFADRQGRLTYLDTGSTGGTYTSYRTNLITNPSAETTTGLVTGSQSTTQKKYGTYSFAAAKPGSEYQVYYSTTGQGNSAVYTLSAWVYAADTSYRNYTITAERYTSGGGGSLGNTSATFQLKGAGWFQIGVTFTGGGSTWTGADSFGVNITAESATTSTFYVDGIMLEQTAGIYDFFDGSNVPTGNTYTTYTSAWTGTANASTSTLTITSTFSNITTGSFTVTDTTGITYSGIEMAYGAETLYNRVVLDWPWRTDAQSPIIVNDSSSQSTYGVKALELYDNLLNDTTLRTNRATAALNAFKSPEFRINSVTVDIHALTSAQQTTLSTQDIGSTCTVTFTPNKVGSAISPTGYTVIGISESITPDTYQTTYYLSASGSLGRVGGAGGPGLE